MILSKFVESFSELIFQSNISVAELSKSLGCEKATIYRYLRGEKMPSVDMAIRMADYFSCSVDYLLGLEDEKYLRNFKPCPTFQEQLPILCEKLKTNKYQIQKRTGIAESAIYGWQKGTTSPNIDTLVKIAQAFDCSVDFILGRSDI